MILSKTIPNSAKKIAKRFASPLPLIFRMGKKYQETKGFIQNAQWWDKDKIEEWQLQRLGHIVKYAYENVSGYHVLYKEAGVKPEDIQTLSDVACLPFVTKAMIRDNLASFTSRVIPKSKQIYGTTSGSTGMPFGFHYTELNKSIEKAFMYSGWERAGWRLGESSAVLKGASFVGSEEKFWEYDPYNRQLLLSSYYLTERTYDKYVAKILEYKAPYLQAYPSAATILADLISKRADTGKLNFKAILLSSENVYDWQRQKLFEAFVRSKLFGWYGLTEQVILAPECEYSHQYHVWPFYGFTEILSEKGEEQEEGEIGELVGTSFWNYATPFIRYRTMDLAKKGKSGCEKCTRQFQLLEKIQGRLQEIIVTNTGRYISMTAMTVHSDAFHNVEQFQFYQDRPGRVSFRIVRRGNYTERDTSKIRSDLMTKLGEDMELEIIFVDKILRTPNGKYRVLEQELKIKYGE